MEITHNIQSSLAKFHGSSATVSSYGRFGAVLTIAIQHQDAKWYVSFSDCERIAFPSGWSIDIFTASAEAQGRLRVSDDSAGFEVICKNCYLIHEDEYMADEVESPT